MDEDQDLPNGRGTFRKTPMADFPNILCTHETIHSSGILLSLVYDEAIQLLAPGVLRCRSHVAVDVSRHGSGQRI